MGCRRPRRSGAVRAVAVEDAARVDDDEHARLDRRVAGDGVRRGLSAPAPTTASKETPSAPPSRKLRSIHHASSRSLRPLNRSCASAANTSSDSALARHARDLVVILDRAERLHETGDRNRVDPRIRERAEERVREMLLLDQDPPSAQELADRGNEAARGFDDLGAVERPCTIRIAEVRVQRRRAVGLDEYGRIRAVQPGQVADVRLPAEDVRRPGDEQRLLEQRGESFDSGHSCPATRNSIASRYPSGPFPMKRAATSSSTERTPLLRFSMLERCTSTTGAVNSSSASRIAHE